MKRTLLTALLLAGSILPQTTGPGYNPPPNGGPYNLSCGEWIPVWTWLGPIPFLVGFTWVTTKCSQ